MRTRTVATLVAVLLLGGCMSYTSHIADYETETEHLADTLTAMLPAQALDDRSLIVSQLAVEPSGHAGQRPTDIVWWEWHNAVYFGDDKDAPRAAVEPLDTYLLDNGWTKTPTPYGESDLSDSFDYRKNDERGGNWYIRVTNTTPAIETTVPYLDMLIVSPTTQRGDDDNGEPTL